MFVMKRENGKWILGRFQRELRKIKRWINKNIYRTNRDQWSLSLKFKGRSLSDGKKNYGDDDNDDDEQTNK